MYVSWPTSEFDFDYINIGDVVKVGVWLVRDGIYDDYVVSFIIDATTLLCRASR